MVCKRFALRKIIMTYTLKNKNYTLEIDSLGAELKSSKYKNEEYLHIGDDTYWSRSSPVLFPIIGKLKDDKYTYKGKEYFMSKHGFARNSNFELIEQSSTSLSFLLCENESTLKVFPFSFSLKLTYILEEDGFFIKYDVNSSDDILFSLGAHPAFLLKADINETYLEFQEKEQKDLLCLNLDNGCVEARKKEYLNSNILKLKSDIFKDDALIFEALKSKTISLKNTKNKKSVSVTSDSFTHIGFWAPLKAPFVCIEPWCGIADDINTNHKFEDKKALVKLKSKEVFKRTMLISFS